MQEQLDLDEQRYMDTLSTPPVAVSMLGSTAGFLDKLETFNRLYDTDIEVQKSARWQQGTYPKFKALARRITFPRLDQAKTIRNIFRTDGYNVNRVLSEVMALDNRLKDIRAQGIKFFQDEDVEGQLALDTLMDNLNQSIVDNLDIKVEISQNPWFNKQYHHDRNSIYQPTYPIMDNNGNILSYENIIINPPESDNPSDWFINIAIPLKDVVIDMEKRGERFYSFEYGDLVVAQTICLKKAVMLTRRVQNDTANNMNIENFFDGFTYRFPKYSELQHPFVCRERDDSSVRSRTSQFSTGNTCFGGFQSQILCTLASGKITAAVPMLKRWATYYTKDNISPLNRYYYSVFGKPSAVGKHDWQMQPSTCENQIMRYPKEISIKDFMDTFCSDCQHIQACDVNREWSSDPIVFTFENDAEASCWNAFIMDTWTSYAVNLPHKYADTDMWSYHLEKIFVQCKKDVLRRQGINIFNHFHVNGYGGGFLSSNAFNDVCEEMKLKDSFDIDDFIFYFKLCEEIFYRERRDYMELGSIEDIALIRTHCLARQRAERISERRLETFTSRL